MWQNQNNTENEGFSYISPEQQRKSAARILIIETSILIVVCIGIIFLLNYLGIISISGIYKNLNFSREENPRIKSQRIADEYNRAAKKAAEDLSKINKDRQVSTDGLTLSLSSVSDIPSYRLRVLNENNLKNLLKDWKIYGKKHNGLDPITDIILHFTDKEQVGNVYRSKDTGVYLSSIITVNKSKMDVIVQVAPVILKDSTKDISRYYQSQLLSTLYRYAFPVYTPNGWDEQTKSLTQKLSDPALTKLMLKLEKL